MTKTQIVRIAGAILLASATAACAAPATGPRVYDGRQPPACNAQDVRVRHFSGDGHASAHPDHAHLGHGHKWSKRNFKGYATKPPCYVRADAGTAFTSGGLS